ncbi:type 2 lanthipeptide synthetase LanM family protein [Actinophytocola oryzae]|uniref:Lantibiotic modifying enzyme n=1 Tax=Actinophytocola oryzae TaxID=502181 RepID=A0A4R7VKG6_9PSEU|nr:type 2 lanthipeptide synthetase LanM family protein [Actinophytocola oryzae]TDV49737.1 lantibiotic modifying enzyme [Actinophytocola oryzae]
MSLPSTSTGRPDWAEFVERAVGTAHPSGPAPLLDLARERVARGAGQYAELADLSSVCDQFADRLGERLARLLAGTPAPDGLAALLAEYPVLARLLAQTCLHAVDATLELLTRFAADRDTIVELLFGGVDPGRLTTVRTSVREHGRGRAVAVLRFADGRAVVYKPRSPALLRHFGELVSWLNKTIPGLALRPVTTVVRPGHGWVEFVAPRPCASVAEVDRFYRRQGALLALLYAVDAVDLHHENLVAAGDQPVLVDVETLFHATLDPVAGQDPAALALRSSVTRTALLPAPLGAGRPRLGEKDVDPAEYRFALLTGFRAGYDAIVAHRDELTGSGGLLSRCGDDEIRLLARPAGAYAALLAESTRPDLLRDDRDRERFFAGPGTPDGPLVRFEVADLVAGEVPVFVGRPGSRDAWTRDGERIPGLLDVSGLDAATAKITDLDEVDRLDQEWLIAAAMAARTGPVDHRGGDPAPEPAATGVPDPPSLLAAACGIADQLVARSLQDEDRANWLGLEPVAGRHWALAPLGAGLGDGYTGVALFLAQLGRLTDTDRYRELARKAIRPLPGLLDTLGDEPEPARTLGPGGFLGLGGICYALSRMSTLLGDGECADWLSRAVELTGTLADVPGGSAGVATGYAGGLLAMLAVHEETGLASAGDVAARFAARLGETVVAGPYSPAGFAGGAAGVAYAMRRFTGTGTAPAPQPVADDDFGWCGGMSGVLLAAADHEPAAVDDAVAALAARRPLRDTSLCHGELGIVDALTVLALRGHEGAARTRVHYAARAIGALDRGGPRCGTPGGVPSPGLLTGLAGIGYGFLRLGFADQVPSVLLLEPASPDR